MNPLLLFMLCFLLVLICTANHLCMYIHTLRVGVCLLGIRAQSHYWLNGGTRSSSSLSSLKLPDSATPNSLHDRSIFALFCVDAKES